jgi:hypothetical protein
VRRRCLSLGHCVDRAWAVQQTASVGGRAGLLQTGRSELNDPRPDLALRISGVPNPALGMSKASRSGNAEWTLTNRSARAAAGFVVNEAVRFFALEQNSNLLLPFCYPTR